MITNNIYYDIILFCTIVILSYLFGWISKITRIPSVLLLIALGLGCQFLMQVYGLHLGSQVFNLLQLLGIVGLIMIVLEAALDLRLTRDKRTLIWKAFFVALFALMGTSVAIAFLFEYFLGFTFYIAFVYAIPLSIMSSAIIIPSVSVLREDKKEFMIYESTFSDILGIMLFYFVIGANENDTPLEITQEVTLNTLATVFLSVLASYALVWIFQRVQKSARLFLLISVLILLYSIGKIFHLSSLIVILVFGLMLSNYRLFFIGKLSGWVDGDRLKRINEEFHLVTLESAFVVRTFFFVVFGLTLELDSLSDWQTALVSVCVAGAIYGVRILCLRPAKRSIFPEVAIAPRGLITVLLFFAIPAQHAQPAFSNGIILYSILITGVVMTLGMIFTKSEAVDVPELSFDSLDDLDNELIRK